MLKLLRCDVFDVDINLVNNLADTLTYVVDVVSVNLIKILLFSLRSLTAVEVAVRLLSYNRKL